MSRDQHRRGLLRRGARQAVEELAAEALWQLARRIVAAPVRLVFRGLANGVDLGL